MEGLGKRGEKVSALFRRRASEVGRARQHANAPRPRRKAALHVGEIYGFVGAIATSVFAVVYFLWAYIPEDALGALGIHYYPSKYWALAAPVWISAAVVAAFWLYEGLCMIASQPLHSICSIEDEGCRWETQLTREQRKMPVLCEMPLTEVNALIFDRRKRG